MYPKRIGVIAECVQLTRQVDRIPEEYAIKIFAASRADQPFDERMRNGDVRDRLDLVDFEYTKVRKPAVETKERIVVGTDVFR